MCPRTRPVLHSLAWREARRGRVAWQESLELPSPPSAACDQRARRHLHAKLAPISPSALHLHHHQPAAGSVGAAHHVVLAAVQQALELRAVDAARAGEQVQQGSSSDLLAEASESGCSGPGEQEVQGRVEALPTDSDDLTGDVPQRRHVVLEPLGRLLAAAAAAAGPGATPFLDDDGQASWASDPEPDDPDDEGDSWAAEAQEEKDSARLAGGGREMSWQARQEGRWQDAGDWLLDGALAADWRFLR